MYKWCNCFNCWVSDVFEITEGVAACGYECSDCEDCEEIKPSY